MAVANKSFGYYLKAKRQQLGLSQADLADKTKVQRTSISRLESFSGNPQWTMIRLLAEEGMGISVAELFQVEPKESAQPIIQVGADIPGHKLAELMLQTQGKAIPLVNNPTPLRTKVVTDQDIAGYCVLDFGLIKEYKDKTLIAWVCPGSEAACSWLVADIKDATFADQGIFLVVLDGEVQPRRVWIGSRGELILDAINGDDTRPIGFWGRQKDRIEVLGRVVMTAKSYRHP